MKNKIFTTIVLIVVVATCLIVLCSCGNKTADTNNPTGGSANGSTGENTNSPTCENCVVFGKKYYSLNGNGLNKDQYYQFNEDGTAICSITIKEDDVETFKSTINFKWFYAGNGDFVMLHNGTRVLVGKQDSVMGFGRVMHTTKCAMYWDNMYYISEDCVNTIPNFGKLLSGLRKLNPLPRLWDEPQKDASPR